MKTTKNSTKIFQAIIALIVINFLGFAVMAISLYRVQGNELGDEFGATATIPKAVALFETSLANSISGTATSLTLTSGTDKEGNSLSGTYGFIIDEGSANEEFVLCTAAGTALTSCSRGLSVSAPASSSSSLKETHRRGASVKITDWPMIGVFQRLLDGTDEFPAILTYASAVAACSANDDICDKAYIDGVVSAGASDANLTTKGLVEQATIAQINAGDGAGDSTTARLFVNPSYLASSNYGLNIPTAAEKAGIAGTLASPSATNKFISLSNLWARDITTSQKLIAFSLTASATGDILVRNSSGDYFNLAASLSGTVLTSQGTGSLVKWSTPTKASISATDKTVGPSDTTEITLYTANIPASMMGTSNGLRFRVSVSDLDLSDGGSVAIRMKYGGTTVVTGTIGEDGSAAVTSKNGWIEGVLFNTNSTAAQEGTMGWTLGVDNFEISTATQTGAIGQAVGTSTVDSAAAQTFSITAQLAVSGASDAITVSNFILEKIQ